MHHFWRIIQLGVPAGILATGLIGLVAMFKGLSDAEHTLIEQSEMEQYGDTVSNIVDGLKESAKAVKERAEAAVEYVQTAGLSEMQMASDLADKYFNLAEKENLSNEEKTEMKTLASLLVEKFPELEECYNTENGLLETSRKRVKELIDEKLKNIQLNALEEQLTQAYKDQYNQLQAVKEATELVNGEKEKLNKLEGEYNDLSSKQDMLNEYYNLSDKIIGVQGDTTELQKRQQELWDELTNGGQDALPTYEQLSVEMEAVSEKMGLIKPSYEEALSGLSEATGAYDAASKSVSELSNMLSTGMYGAAENGVAGFDKGMSDNTDVIKEANTLLMEAGMKSATDALDEHSPSKKYEKFGKYSVDGYNLGFTKNEKTTIQTIKRFMDNVLSKFREMIEPVKQVGSDIMSGFCDAITGWEDKLYKRIDKISNNFTKKIKNMYGSISNTGTVSGNVTLTLSMPKFATGGVVTRPTLGMFGEDGAEAIVPLEKNTGWINSVAEQMQGFSSNESDELLREQNNLLRQQNALLSELANKEVVATLDTSRKTIKGLRDAEKRLGFSFT